MWGKTKGIVQESVDEIVTVKRTRMEGDRNRTRGEKEIGKVGTDCQAGIKM